MHLQKHSLDGGDHFGPEVITGTNQQMFRWSVEMKRLNPLLDIPEPQHRIEQ